MTPLAEIAADPFPWPLEALRPQDCALVIVDMQRDFLSPEGYFAMLGHDISGLTAAIEPTRRCLDAARSAGLRVVHTRQGYRADLADMPAWRRIKAERYGSPVAADGPLGRVLVRGEPGFEIIDELAPRDGEPVVDKTANGAFCDTDLDRVLRAAGLRALVFAGITIDVCVHTSLREANDRGYQCALIADACGALEPGLHEWALDSIRIEGGVFGSVTDSARFVAGLGRGA